MRTKQQKQKRTIVGLVTAMICLLMFSVTMTFAFFTASNNATSNTMQFGTLAVGVNGFAVSNADSHTLVPGCTINLDGNIELAGRENDAESGTITSNSTIGAFVRIKLTIEPATNGDTLPDTTSLMSAIVAAFGASWKTSGSDGYLYYAGKFMPVGTSNLGTNEVTSFDLSTVSFVVDREAFGNAWQDKAFVLKIEAEAIQAEHTGVTAAQITTGGQTLVDAISGVDTWSAISSANGGSNQEENNPLAEASLQYLDFEVVGWNTDYEEWSSQGALVSESDVEMSTLNDSKAQMSNLMVDGTRFVGVKSKEENYEKVATGDIVLPSYVKVDNNEVVLATKAEWEANNAYKVAVILGSAFSYCYELTSILIPSSIECICDSAFESCGLTSITIPSSIKILEGYAFHSCSSLTSIYFNANLDDYEDHHGPFTWVGNSENGATIVIGSNVTRIPAYFLSDSYDSGYSDYITSIMFEENSTCTSIGESAFYTCPITSINLPSTIEIIETFAFASTGITGITIPNSVTSIEQYTFSYCSELASITIPNSVTSIEQYAFTYCSGLISVTIPNSVTNIGEYAFSGCDGLTSVTIPEEMEIIGNGAFENCTGLINIYYNAINAVVGFYDPDRPDLDYINLHSHGQTAAFGSYYWIDENTEFTPITLTIGVNVQSIPYGLLSDDDGGKVSAVTSVVFLGNSLTTLGHCAFNGCHITTITLPSSLTSIGSGTFNCCEYLTSVTFGNANGWGIADSYGATITEALSSSDLSDPSTAATYLTNTYIGYVWIRN